MGFTRPTTLCQSTVAGTSRASPNYHANVNIQYTQGIAFPTPHIFYSTASQPPFTPDSSSLINTNQPILDWLEYVLSQQNIPPTVSMSYGENEQTVPPDYAISVCDLFATLGLRGVSVLASSPRAAASASALGTAGSMTALTKSSSSPGTPHPVRMAHYTQVQVQDAHHTGTLTQVPG
jgi:hypothetical protein